MSPRQTSDPRVTVVSARMTYAEYRRVVRALRLPNESDSAMVRRVLMEATQRATK